jgi:hypothetical protein
MGKLEKDETWESLVSLSRCSRGALWLSHTATHVGKQANHCSFERV